MCAPFLRSARFCQLLLGAAALALFSGCQPRQAASRDPERPLRVAAAADLEPAFSALGRRFTELDAQQHSGPGRAVVFSFASSSLLAQQVRQGAPFDLFAAASVSLVEQLCASGQLVPSSSRPYARGQLVLLAGAGRPLPRSLEELALPPGGRLALANPAHAPYGQAASEALTAAGLLPSLRQRLVFGENVRQAHQFVDTGNADYGLGALSLIAGRGQAVGAAPTVTRPYLLVAARLYRPLIQQLGIVRSGDQAGASRFAALVLSDEGQRILSRYGFLPP